MGSSIRAGAGQVFDHLEGSPALWLALTLGAYVIADAVADRCRRHPLANPVAISIALIAAVLMATGTPYATYFQGARFIHFLLGPATVALAVPLIDNFARVRRNLVPMVAALLAGSATAVVSAVLIARAFGASMPLLATLAPKSVTAPIAMGVSERIGGIASLAAVIVVATGVVGAVISTPLFDLLRVRDQAARGFATGIAAHGIGTARAFQLNEVAGTFAGIGMALNGILTALALPFLFALLAR